MELPQRINQDITAALKAKDAPSLRALRALKTGFQLAETAEGRTPGPLSGPEALIVLAKQIKQRRDSLEQFRANGREDLASAEAEEIVVLERYQPAMLSAEEMERQIRQVIDQLEASGPKDMGRVMKEAQSRMAGQVEGRALSEAVKRILGS